jgi:hypothetical protein
VEIKEIKGNQGDRCAYCVTGRATRDADSGGWACNYFDHADERAARAEPDGDAERE